MRGVVFTYHSQNCGGYSYSSNDHLAFEKDLSTVEKYGLPIISLQEIAENISSGTGEGLPPRFVAFSCDDGSLLDWHDYHHPEFGIQRSFANLLREHLARYDKKADSLLTSFVIASAAAREAIDIGCYRGEPLSDDSWWLQAATEGLVSVQNHSWDHVHAVLPVPLIKHGEAENFYSVDDFTKAEVQVRLASEEIDRILAPSGHRVTLFAYPYGHVSPYLANEYFPRYYPEHGVLAAFTTQQKFIDESSKPYSLPRLVCGDAWCSEKQFDDILKQLISD